MPRALALEMLLTGDPIDAARAEAAGLVNKVVDDGTALEAALALAARIAVNGPLGVAASKRIVRKSPDWGADRWERHDAIVRPVLTSEDAREGTTAFAEARPGLARSLSQATNASQIRKAFSPTTTAATTTAAAVVTRWLTRSPITAARGQPHQRDQRERDPERQHDLGEHQRLRRVDPDAQHDQRGSEGQQPAQQQRDPTAQEPGHDDLPGVGPDARGREPRGEQRDREPVRGDGVELTAQPGEDALQGVGAGHVGAGEQGGRDDQHRQVDQPGHAHPERDVGAPDPQQEPGVLRATGDQAAWVSAECR